MKRADALFCEDSGALATTSVYARLGSQQAQRECAAVARKRYGRPARVIDLYLRSSPGSPAREALWNYFDKEADERYKAKVAAQGGDGALTRLSMLALFAIGLLGAIAPPRLARDPPLHPGRDRLRPPARRALRALLPAARRRRPARLQDLGPDPARRLPGEGDLRRLPLDRPARDRGPRPPRGPRRLGHRLPAQLRLHLGGLPQARRSRRLALGDPPRASWPRPLRLRGAQPRAPRRAPGQGRRAPRPVGAPPAPPAGGSPSAASQPVAQPPRACTRAPAPSPSAASPRRAETVRTYEAANPEARPTRNPQEADRGPLAPDLGAASAIAAASPEPLPRTRPGDLRGRPRAARPRRAQPGPTRHPLQQPRTSSASPPRTAACCATNKDPAEHAHRAGYERRRFEELRGPDRERAEAEIETRPRARPEPPRDRRASPPDGSPVAVGSPPSVCART